MTENRGLRYVPLREAQCRAHGRTDRSRDPLPLFWNGSFVEVNVTGSELWIDLEVDYENYEPWVSCDINGAFMSRQMLMPGRYRLCLFRGMDPEKVKNVRFFRELQAMSEDDANHILVHGFAADGAFQPVPEARYRLEFIGDSITSGEGTYGALEEADWISMFMSASKNYAVMTSRALGADFHLLSQGGWGVLCGWDNNPHNNLPFCYEEICGLLHGSSNEALGAHKPWDFASWQPDAVIVNLGTNDASAFHQPAWTDPATGESFKQHLEADGSWRTADIERFRQAVIRFLKVIRKNNPKAHIVWTYGMLGYELTLPITEAISRYRAETGDYNTAFLQLPNTTRETVGSHEHPGAKSHERAAGVLTEYLRTVLEGV